MTDAGSNEPRFLRHYDRLERGSAERDEANRERLRVTAAMVPDGVGTILDVGCGDGTASEPLRAHGRVVFGVDVSLEALRLMGGGHGSAASVTALPFADRSIDLVLALEVVEHMPGAMLGAAVAELARVSRRHVIVSTPNAEHLPSGEARCADCGARFHRNLHFASLDRAAHGSLLDAHSFRCVETAGVASWRQSPAWTSLRRAVGGDAALKPVLVFPACGACGRPPTEAPLLRRAALRLVDGAAWRATRPVPRWLVSLYGRVGPEPSGPLAR